MYLLEFHISIYFEIMYTVIGIHSFLQGIFPITGSIQNLLSCKQILYPMSHQGSPHY